VIENLGAVMIREAAAKTSEVAGDGTTSATILALATLIVNKIRSTLKMAAVKSPGFGDNKKEILEDIAALCRTRVISEELGTSLDKIRLEDLGTCKSIRIDKDSTTIVDGKGSKQDIQCRIYRIRNLIKISSSEYDCKKLQERMAKLTGGVAVIRIGAASAFFVKIFNALFTTHGNPPGFSI
jgi:chaperonin GroEL